jgi:hypothetical protein
MKSMMVELTDETNKARGFAMISVAWAVGGTLGFDMSLHSFIHWLISEPPDLSLVVCYHDHRIVGQISFRILSGENTHTSCRVLLPQLTLF